MVLGTDGGAAPELPEAGEIARGTALPPFVLSARHFRNLKLGSRALNRLVEQLTGEPFPIELAAPGPPAASRAPGAGEILFEESPDSPIQIRRDALPDWARDGCFFCFRADDDSMEPTIQNGDLLVVDASRTKPEDGQVIVAETAEGLVVGRLRRESAGWVLISDNDRHPPRPADARARIAGRVAWSGPACGRPC